MKLTLKQIWESQQAMPKLLGRDLSNIKASYWIGRNAKTLDGEFTALNEKRIQLVKKFGVEDKAANKWDIPADKRDDFNKAFAELLDTEIDINITQIDISMLSDAKLSPSDTVSIDFMLKES
jgi:hypothetical protein